MVTTTTSDDPKKRSNEKLAEYMSGWKENTGNHVLAQMEFHRRQNKDNEIRGWISLGLATTALIISIVALAV